MRRFLGTCGFALCLLMLASDAGRGQFPGGPLGPPTRGSTPLISPYLNMFRGDQSVFFNYWGLVQPQVSFQRALAGVQQDIGAQANNTQALAAAQAGTLPPTGHASGFQTQGRYFMTMKGGAGGAFGLGKGVGQGAGGARGRPAAGGAPGVGGMGGIGMPGIPGGR